MMRSILRKLCTRRLRNITQPFAIDGNRQIDKIVKSALAVKILRMAIKRLTFFVSYKRNVLIVVSSKYMSLSTF